MTARKSIAIGAATALTNGDLVIHYTDGSDKSFTLHASERTPRLGFNVLVFAMIDAHSCFTALGLDRFIPVSGEMPRDGWVVTQAAHQYLRATLDLEYPAGYHLDLRQVASWDKTSVITLPPPRNAEIFVKCASPTPRDIN